MNAILLLGKTGDIVNSLPIAKHLADAQGGKIDWIVANNYASVLTGVSYVRPVKLAFHVHEALRAIKMQEPKYERIYMAQTFGKSWGGRRDLPHNVVAWLNCGFTEEQFADLRGFPLVFDRRDPGRENFIYRKHVTSNKPLILLSVGCGRSAPFASHHVFSEAIRRKWGQSCMILNLCHVKAGRFYDLLGLMERARLLITSDSSPMHLATAVPALPVIALAGEKTYTAAQPRYRTVARYRYGDTIRQMKEVHQSVYSALTASAQPGEIPPVAETAPQSSS